MQEVEKIRVVATDHSREDPGRMRMLANH
jgi:hypothetical protein